MKQMKKWCSLFVLICALFTFSACGGGNADELLDTAKLEEKQNNPEHAIKLYKEIMEKYPDSDAAKTAGERLKTLTP